MASIFGQNNKKQFTVNRSVIAVLVAAVVCLCAVGIAFSEQAAALVRTGGAEGSKTSITKFNGKIKPFSAKLKSYEGAKRVSEKETATLKATWYTGDVLGFRGSGGKLTHAKSVALNNSQRRALGLEYGQEVYLEFPGVHSSLSGWYEIKDSGCASGVVDMFYKSRGSVPSKFKSAGVVWSVKLYKERPKKLKGSLK
ncbi:MAG: hypothetical protein LBG82_00060 [Clostridiales Family XIII bacterium]|jgi:hypothetical protein|nr:hypothetical protein [Clostridiales Family XIII bacterium]